MFRSSGVVRHGAFLAVVVFAAVVASAEQPPTATLTLEPAATLPSLPVAFVVTIANPTDQPLQIWDVMTLKVTTATGSFDAKGLDGRTAVPLPHDGSDPCSPFQCITIAAHGQKQVYVNYRPELTGNEFFDDERLTVPGSYALQLSLYTGAPGARGIAIASNSATLTVREPAGVDRDVWQSLLQSPAHGWKVTQWMSTGDLVAVKLRSDYPASSYIPWVAALGRAIPPATAVSNLDAALTTNPTPSLRDNLLWSKGMTLARLSESMLYTNRDVDQAVVFADRARTAYETLSNVAISDSLRRVAAAAILKLYTRSTAMATLQQLAAGDPPAPAAVVPRVECVTKVSGQSFTARFGYTNPNRAMKVLQIGNINQVTPAPRDQGQPRVFKPGDHADVFTATSPGGELKWHLDGSQAVASADFPVQCTAATPPPPP